MKAVDVLDDPNSHLPSPVVLVTGAARRIGAQVVRFLHQQGARVVVHYASSAQQAGELVQALNAQRADSAMAVQAHLQDPAAMTALIDTVLAWQGRLDWLVNNASAFYRTPMADWKVAAWDDLMTINARAPLMLARAAHSALLASGRGAIVNISDVRVPRPLPEFAAYSASKAALDSLTRTLALEWAPQVRVNAVAPGSLDWPEQGVFAPAEEQAMQAAIPMQRLGGGGDIARAVYFLLAHAPYVTGHILPVDGGSSLVSV